MDVQKELDRLKDLVGLKDWTVDFDLEPAQSDEAGLCWRTYGQQHGTIQVGPEFWQLSDERKNQVLIHELVHLHVDPLKQSLSGIENQINPSTWSTFITLYVERLEILVDNISRILSLYIGNTGIRDTGDILPAQPIGAVYTKG